MRTEIWWGNEMIDIDDDEITEGTLRNIFLQNLEVDRPGGNIWTVKPRKPHRRSRRSRRKQYRLVVGFLRMIMSWKLDDQFDFHLLNDRRVLRWLTKYIQRTYNDLYVYKSYEKYEFWLIQSQLF